MRINAAIATAVIGVLATSAPALAQRQNRLTGLGQASMTVSSGRDSTPSRIAFGFRILADHRGAVSGSFTASPADDRKPLVTIDGQQYALETIRATNVVDLQVDFGAPSSYAFGGFGAVDVSDAAGRLVSFQSAVSASGVVGGGGQPFNFVVAIGPGGSQGGVGGQGTTEVGASVNAVTAASVVKHEGILKGFYSGEMHGALEDGAHRHGVLVIAFDGEGGMSGRLTHAGQGTPDLVLGYYSMEADGMGFAYVWTNALYGMFWAMAVGDSGRIVKFNVAGGAGPAYAIGDLVKQ
jgi:hypothetical protein